ncbi:AAA family ATPase [Dolichospermum lemmermannii CS-548]|uniref:AAA family ATPase n=1 Tax=Dolichospermum lemmermannii TaxID=54295 RepID=UPI00232F8377|nr:AAA family ATPase [Dolichospermum lemmermannii]MDB9436822.1 AAA family ATPase [Dolichospermum lemmermannii CS-548]
MKLLQVQVPDFRVLKDVDIKFDRRFVPNIFPLGSLNGGGKSTLLQLVFVLLHCCTNPERKVFIKNLLHGFTLNDDSSDRVLAIIKVWDGEKEVEIKFLVCHNTYIETYIENIIKQNNVEIKFPSYNRNYIDENSIKNLLFPDQNNKDSKLYQYLYSQYLPLEHIIYICPYFSGVGVGENHLLCKIGDNLDINKAEAWLDEISNKIFLAAPITQVFLFTSQKSRSLLFQQNSERDYDLDLKSSKLKLPGFFTYDFAPVDLLIKVFTSARDEDFRTAIETEGKYGKRYEELLAELSLLLANKKVNISTDFSKITFKLDTNNENIELYPEDLSHGELKRLSIYLWIKYSKIKNAIVLMDEIEIGFHPDWQYEIIRDLEEWSSSNQYILATHSYQLCRALTPAHVRELEPKLIKSDNNIPL